MDKNKIIEGATKLVAKGAYDKAIKEYQKALSADPKDVRILQKLGELYQKKNDNTEAANYFIKVGESYAADGFFLKAVALYKQVLKLNPDLLEVNLKLAELHHQLGLLSEATTYFQLVANHYDKQGDTKSSLDTLKKIVDLDPDNASSRTKLGELYAREGMKVEAIREFRAVAEYFKTHNRADDHLRVMERISSLEPSDLGLARELSKSYLAKGDQKRALAKLQVCFKADPRDLGTLEMLAEAFNGLGQSSKTISVYKELIKVYSDTGRSREADAVWTKIGQLDPMDVDFTGRNPPKATPPAPAPVSSGAQSHAAPTTATRPAPIASSSGARKDQLGKLLTETDVYVKYGLHEKALEHLRRIFQVDPENLEAHEKAYQIYVAAKQSAQALDQLLNVLRLLTRKADSALGKPYLEQLHQLDPKHPELPVFMAVLSPGGFPSAHHGDDDAILMDASDEEVSVPEAPADALATPAFAGPTSFSMRTPSPKRGAPAPELQDEPMFAGEMDEDLTVVDSTMEESPVDDPALLVAAQRDVLDDAMVMDESTSPGKYVDDPALLPFPQEDERHDDSTIYVEDPIGAHSTVHGESAFGEDESNVTTQIDDPVAHELEEAAFLLEQGLLSDAREVLETVMIASPGHPRGQELMHRLDSLEGHTTEQSGGYDLAAELADDFQEPGAEPAATSGGDDFQYSVEEVFSEFKKGIEKVVKPEDVDTHYDLGIAYKEMGLSDDAIGEFEVARQGCLGKKKEIDCLTMIAVLQGAKGNWTKAVESYKTALRSEHAKGETQKALLFDLGAAHESAGEVDLAREAFQKVAAMDPGYREVEAAIARLPASSGRPPPARARAR